MKAGIRRAVVALLFAFSAGSTPADSAPRVAGELDAPGLARMLAGHKGCVVLLNFWATWCVPCREEFPDLSKLQNRNRAAGFQLIGISTDFARQRAAVDAFIAEQRPAFPNYWKKTGGDEAFIEAVDSKWGGELPFSVLFDRSGRKVRVYSGALPVATAEKEIRRLLASR